MNRFNTLSKYVRFNLRSKVKHILVEKGTRTACGLDTGVDDLCTEEVGKFYRVCKNCERAKS